MLLGQVRGTKTGALNQRLQAQAGRLAQHNQALLQQIARVAGLLGYIGHNAQRHQIQQRLTLGGASVSPVQSLGQLIGHAYTGQFTQGMSGQQTLWIDNGLGRRQRLGQIVMIGDNDLNAGGLGDGNSLVLGNTGITSQNQLDAGGDESLQSWEFDAVRLGQPVGDVEAYLGTQALQG